MPQLDPTWIISQVFWVLICFGLTFLMMKVLIVPKIMSVIDDRDERIKTDIKIAKNLKLELEEAIVAYEESLDQAYDKAREILKQTNEEIQAFVKNEESEFSSRMKKRTDEAKGKIETAKEKILIEVEAISMDLTDSVLKKLTTDRFPEDVIRDNVKKEMKGA